MNKILLLLILAMAYCLNSNCFAQNDDESIFAPTFATPEEKTAWEDRLKQVVENTKNANLKGLEIKSFKFTPCNEQSHKSATPSKLSSIYIKKNGNIVISFSVTELCGIDEFTEGVEIVNKKTINIYALGKGSMRCTCTYCFEMELKADKKKFKTKKLRKAFIIGSSSKEAIPIYRE